MEENKVEYKNIGGFNFVKHTPDAACEVIVAEALAAKRGSRERIRIFIGDIKTGRSFNEIYETQGYVGRSTGVLPIALLIATNRSRGGGPICGSIVRITKNKKVLYTHPDFHIGETKIVGKVIDGEQKYVLYIKTNKGWEANVQVADYKDAEKWVEFYKGTRNKV